LIRTIDSVDIQDLFNTDYGIVNQSKVVKSLENSLGRGTEQNTSNQQDSMIQDFSSTLIRILQDEFEKIDREVREYIEECFIDMINITLESEDKKELIQELRYYLQRENIKWHSAAKGWPSEIEWPPNEDLDGKDE
jgi:hypothetical protein